MVKHHLIGASNQTRFQIVALLNGSHTQANIRFLLDTECFVGHKFELAFQLAYKWRVNVRLEATGSYQFSESHQA